MWGPIIAPVRRCFRCYCIDTVTDANRSVATKRVRGASDYVDWLRQTFGALDITNARVAGLSYGGWLAAVAGVHTPELVNRLVVMSPAATLARITNQWLIRTVSAAMLRSHSVRRAKRPVVGGKQAVRGLRSGHGAGRAALHLGPGIASVATASTDQAHRRRTPPDQRTYHRVARRARSHLRRRPTGRTCAGAQGHPRRPCPPPAQRRPRDDTGRS